MSVLPVLPIAIPLACAIASLLLRGSPRAQRVVGVAGTGALLAASAALLVGASGGAVTVVRFGDWPVPFAITFVVDILAALMTTLGALMGFATALYSVGSARPADERFGYWPLLHVLLMGVSGAFLTGDLFNLYVWFEVLLMASFVLMALGGGRAQLEGSVKYTVLSLVSSILFLASVGLVYALTGALNMADVAVRLRAVEAPGLVSAVAVLFLGAFGVKAAVFPLFGWLPASYHTPPAAVSALFAGLLTKVGVYAMIRVFTLVFPGGDGGLHPLILAVAAVTMVTGVLGAACQMEFRRVLSFHIVSQVGYMVMGLGLLNPLGLAGSVFYLAHHIVVKTNLFFVAGIVERLGGSGDLGRLGGLWRRRPALGLLFLVPAFSLAGIPPLSGFWAKLLLLRAGLDAGAFWIVAVAAAVGLLTLFSMTKIWAEAFWKEGQEASSGPMDTRGIAWMAIPAVGLAAITIAIGFGAGEMFALAERAAAQLGDPAGYCDAVLGRKGAR